ncbi:hypothetical protein BsWGS_21538 [Bradybaena similaris]
MANDLNPLAVLLVTSGTRGNRLLFRYPYSEEPTAKQKTKKPSGKNPYTIKIAENLQDVKKEKPYSIFMKDSVLAGISNQTLANFLIVKSELCGEKFSVQIDDVRFVGFPTSLQHLKRDSNQQSVQNVSSRQHNILTVNVVFVLRAQVAESVVSCYQELAQQLTVAIAQEEKRCQYLTKEAKIIMTAFEETNVNGDDDIVAPLKQIILLSNLARELKSAFDSLQTCGQVLFYMNQWIEINFCLPHKIHAMHTPGRTIQLESIYSEFFIRCLSYVRPYHGILLTKSVKVLLNILPLDSSPSLIRLIRLTTPLKNLKVLALETDLSITQIYQLVCHMIYWGFAMLIYPLCQSNIYVLSPSANTAVDSQLSKEFSACFPGLHLVQEMSRFSFPTHISDSSLIVTYPQLLDRHYQAVLWMMQHRLLNQLHTYVNLVPPKKKDVPGYQNQMALSSAHSSNSNVQVVEESYLSILMEDAGQLDHAASNSDIASVNSEESGGLSATQYTSQLSKSPSQEANSDGSVIAEGIKSQYRLQPKDALLNELEPQMKSAILACAASKNPEDLHQFAKLCPYFNGKHHLEMIMYYENLRRSQLETLLDKFQEVLIWCRHEDPATTVL